MAICITCGNNYVNAFEIHKDGKKYTFDCFECAIHHLAPTCQHCKCRIIGHGIEAKNGYYCCAHCAHVAGEHRAKDNVSLNNGD